MKKVAALVGVLALMTVNCAVLADEPASSFTDPAWYTGDTRDKAEMNASGYCTVLITKDDPSNPTIVYIDEADNTFRAAETFLLKADPEPGKYKVSLGAMSGSPKETYFYVGTDSNNSNDLYMKRLQNEVENEDETYNIAYYATINAAQYNTYSYIKLGYDKDGTPDYGAIPLNQGDWTNAAGNPTTYSGEGYVNVVFQLNNVPAAYKDSAAVYLSSSPQGGN